MRGRAQGTQIARRRTTRTSLERGRRRIRHLPPTSSKLAQSVGRLDEKTVELCSEGSGLEVGLGRPEPAEMPELLAKLQESLAGRYVIERQLGRGGMATVYLARDLQHE